MRIYKHLNNCIRATTFNRFNTLHSFNPWKFSKFRCYSTPSQIYLDKVHKNSLVFDTEQHEILQKCDQLSRDIHRFHQNSQVYSKLKSHWCQTLQQNRQRELQSRLNASKFNQIRNQLKIYFGYMKRIEDLTPTDLGMNEFQSIKPMPPRGIFINGDVGCGKTMIMDILYQSLYQSNVPVLRIHYNQWMILIHNGLHEHYMKTKQKTDSEPNGFVIGNVLRGCVLSRFQCEESVELDGSGVLFVDEFSMSDIGDARLSYAVICALIERDCIVIFTANRAPAEVSRVASQCPCLSRFIHEVLANHCESIVFSSKHDYRRLLHSFVEFIAEKNSQVNVKQFFTGKSRFLSGKQSNAQCDQLWRVFGNEYGLESKRVTLELLFQRHLVVEHALCLSRSDCEEQQEFVGAKFEFKELCECARNTVDYVRIAERFQVVCLVNVPKMSLEKRDSARRFVALIDELYNGKCCVLLQVDGDADVDSVEDLFDDSRGGLIDEFGVAEGMQFESESGKDGVGSTNREFGKGTVYSGEDDRFVFQRTVSRLIEMQTDIYLERREN